MVVGLGVLHAFGCVFKTMRFDFELIEDVELIGC